MILVVSGALLLGGPARRLRAGQFTRREPQRVA
jgi:hypothetical protein